MSQTLYDLSYIVSFSPFAGGAPVRSFLLLLFHFFPAPPLPLAPRHPPSPLPPSVSAPLCLVGCCFFFFFFFCLLSITVTSASRYTSSPSERRNDLFPFMGELRCIMDAERRKDANAGWMCIPCVSHENRRVRTNTFYESCPLFKV